MGAPRLTSTSYAILGQLALRPWTTYELVAEMRRNLHYFWPRAETLIYSEVKRLATLGLATSERCYIGRRPRTSYAISDEGRAALQSWLATPPERLLMEFEGLLRVVYAPFGSTEELLLALDRVRADAEETLFVASRIRDEYLAGRASFQRHVHVRAYVYDFLLNHAMMVRSWAMRMSDEVRLWDDLSPEERQERALALFERAADHHAPPEPILTNPYST